MTLNYRIQGEGETLVLLHGLLGSLSNLNSVAQGLKQDYRVIQIDLRNHGQSFWSSEMNYAAMAQDVIVLLQQLTVTQFSLIGHSMGGKTAMTITHLIPEQIKKLVVLDIAPVAYDFHQNGHDRTFEALHAVIEQKAQNRQEVSQILMSMLDNAPLTAFLLKSFDNERKDWKFNLNALSNHITDISGWTVQPPWQGPTLFVKGENSHYIIPQYKDAILSQFPQAKVNIIANAGHNVHTEKPDSVLRAIHRIL